MKINFKKKLLFESWRDLMSAVTNEKELGWTKIIVIISTVTGIITIMWE
jgi:hypothetical protein